MNEDTVRGERGPPFVSSARSLQSRVSSIMACGLMILLGAGMLTWYYTNALSRQSRLKQRTQAAAARRVQGEMPLPAIEGFNPLRTSSADPRGASAESHVETQLPQPLPLMPTSANLGTPGVRPSPYAHSTRKSTDQVERQLAGAVFARESGARAGVPNAVSGATMGGVSMGMGNVAALEDSDSRPVDSRWSDGDIAPLLRPTAIASAHAQVLPTRRFLLAKGAFIDCTLETAIDSTLPGMTTCITATDTFSADGTVVLLERGTKLIGETRGQVKQGIARVFVLWTEARTPVGIVVPLDSPATDELGRSGLSGQISRHFWDRFGAAILISTLDGAVQAAVQSASRGGGPIIYNPSSSESVVTEVLKNSVNIPPTITKQNGDRIQVLVARDVDFRSVYELRSVSTAR
jgi:type IV secretion system protein VirB10